jgi:phosphate transport system protein
MEIVIDDRAVRLLRQPNLSETEVRQIVATLKITNDLERMGDLSVAVAERVISLAVMPSASSPQELQPMVLAVGAMVDNSLNALIRRDTTLAQHVLASDDLVDRHRDQIFEQLMARMSDLPSEIAPGLQYLLASRYLERLADHATNIAEDIIFWIRGLDVRHGRAHGIAAAPF